jgi:acyl carrier protein
MTDSEIFTITARCVAHSLALNPADITLDSRLIQDLNADSLDFIDILFSLEKAFAVKMRNADIDNFLRAEFSESDLVDGRYVHPDKIQQLLHWLPAMQICTTLHRCKYFRLSPLKPLYASRLALRSRAKGTPTHCRRTRTS